MTSKVGQAETLHIWGRPCRIAVVMDSFPGEEISPVQKNAYKLFLQRQGEIFQQAHRRLEQFCKDNYSDDVNWGSFNIFSYFIPHTLYVSRTRNDKRVVGLFCKCRFDRENDVVVRIEDEAVVDVGTQDIIL